MKKIIASAVALMMFGGVAVTTASAVENLFGGYWRVRAYAQNDFVQVDGNSDGSYTRADNRTRIYYTAKFNDDFKFVNKFEHNTTWGDSVGGDIGADGMGIWRIKNSYADFNLGSTNTKVGIMAEYLARGFIFDDDFSGIVVTPSFGNTTMPVGYISVRSEDGGGADFDEGIFFVNANITASETMSVTPYFAYWGAGTGQDEDGMDVGDRSIYYIGADIDAKFDAVSAWGSLIYNGGDIQDADVNGWLFAVGADAGIAHGEFIYGSGDDDKSDNDLDGFQAAPGSYYNYSEILAGGIFDNRDINGAMVDNLILLKGGVTFKPADKVKLVGDLMYAALAEDNAAGESELGWELDGKMTYALMDNLSADFVLAYLFVGDAVGEDDIFEGGVRLSLKF